jgi:hypothetical protein
MFKKTGSGHPAAVQAGGFNKHLQVRGKRYFSSFHIHKYLQACVL